MFMKNEAIKLLHMMTNKKKCNLHILRKENSSVVICLCSWVEVYKRCPQKQWDRTWTLHVGMGEAFGGH